MEELPQPIKEFDGLLPLQLEEDLQDAAIEQKIEEDEFGFPISDYVYEDIDPSQGLEQVYKHIATCKICKRQYGYDADKDKTGLCPICEDKYHKYKKKKRLLNLMKKDEIDKQDKFDKPKDLNTPNSLNLQQVQTK